MKKLLLVLLVVALAAFLLVGCIPVTPGEGEGEGEGESEVTVVVDGAVVIDGLTYVSAGAHDVTVTFPAPVSGIVAASITECSGDYSKGKLNGTIVLFPDATKKIWTGSGTFVSYGPYDCCAAYIEIDTGLCEEIVCIAVPIIIDGEKPYATIAIDVANCTCPGCEVTFTSTSSQPLCDDAVVCCGDDCSGLASWSINLYDFYAFDVCCDPTICEEPFATASGVDCPIDYTTECLAPGTYYAVVNLVDNVGLEQTYYAKLIVAGGTANVNAAGFVPCTIEVHEGTFVGPTVCVEYGDTTDHIGTCDGVGVLFATPAN